MRTSSVKSVFLCIPNTRESHPQTAMCMYVCVCVSIHAYSFVCVSSTKHQVCVSVRACMCACECMCVCIWLCMAAAQMGFVSGAEHESLGDHELDSLRRRRKNQVVFFVAEPACSPSVLCVSSVDAIHLYLTVSLHFHRVYF